MNPSVTVASVIGVIVGVALFVLIIISIDKIKEARHGRYRRKAEAHRARTAGSTHRSTGAGGSTGTVGTATGLTPSVTYGFSGSGGNGGQMWLTSNGAITVQKLSTAPKLSIGRLARSNEGEFEGVGFAAGVVSGSRSFRVDEFGRLRGIHYKQVWRPDENTAECRALEYAKDSTHGLDGCDHGFYAYYEGSNDYGESEYVSGIIEGWGETIVGTRGFRCMKAKIVALSFGPKVSAKHRSLIRRNYPDIPIYETFDRMLAEHPTDAAGAEYSPATDPNFWDKE